MDKVKAKNKRKEKIANIRLNIKHLMYFDGNYKKRYFIINNYKSDDYIEQKKLYLRQKELLETYLKSYCSPLRILSCVKEAFRILQLYTITNYRLENPCIINPDKPSNENFDKRQHMYREEQFILMKDNSTIDSYFIQEYTSQYKNILSDFRRFTVLSLRFGLYIYDLFSNINFIYSSDLSGWVYNENIPDRDIYYPIPDIRWMRDFIDIENLKKHNTTRKRFLKLLSMIMDEQELEKPQESTFISIFIKSNLLSQLHSSFSTRMIGLYLWDLCKNPLNTNTCNPNELIEEMYINKIKEFKSKVVFFRAMRSYLTHTDKCIQSGKFLPY